MHSRKHICQLPEHARADTVVVTAHKFAKAQERLEELKQGGPKVQKQRERLSRNNNKPHEAECKIM